MKKLVTQTEKRGQDGSERATWVRQKRSEMGWRRLAWDLRLRDWVGGEGEMGQHGSGVWGKGVGPVRSGGRKKKKMKGRWMMDR